MPSREDRGRLGAFHACNVGASPLRNVARDCGGAVAVEFAIISIPLLFLMFGGFDLGFAMLTETRISFAVEAAAKCSAISAPMCPSPSQTAAYGASIAGLPGLDALGFLVTTRPAGLM
jgi:Flp pilus assembly protein TadG